MSNTPLTLLKTKSVGILFVLLIVAALGAKPQSEPQKHYGRTVAPMGSVRVPERNLDDIFTAGGLPLPIPDPGVVVATINVPQSLTIQDIDVGVTLTHGWVRDLRLELERDTTYLDTTRFEIDTVWNDDSVIVDIDTLLETLTVQAVLSVVLLDFFPGDNIENLTNTWFDQDAGQSIWDGQPPFTGAYRPIDSVSSLNRFEGTDAIGEWRLRVRDRFILDAGVLESFLIEINGTIELQGTVTNSVNLNPVVNASVVVIDQSSLDTVGRTPTNSLGAYGFSRINPGNYRVLFTAQNYDSLTVDNVVIVEGQPTTQDVQLVPQVGFLDVTSTGDSIQIPDLGRLEVPLEVSAPENIRDLDVTINCKSTWIGEMVFSLKHPDGDTITLFMTANPSLDIGEDMTNCRFDDEATQSFTSGEGPFTGSYRPLDTLSTFDGRSAAGTWVLNAEDYAQLDSAKFSSYTLHFQLASAAADEQIELPDNFALHPAFPNPFNATVSLNLDVAKTQELSLQVFDITGRLVETLHHGKLNAGNHRFYWQPVKAASGVYFVRASAQELAQTQKIVLLK